MNNSFDIYSPNPKQTKMTDESNNVLEQLTRALQQLTTNQPSSSSQVSHEERDIQRSVASATKVPRLKKEKNASEYDIIDYAVQVQNFRDLRNPKGSLLLDKALISELTDLSSCKFCRQAHRRIAKHELSV